VKANINRSVEVISAAVKMSWLQCFFYIGGFCYLAAYVMVCLL